MKKFFILYAAMSMSVSRNHQSLGDGRERDVTEQKVNAIFREEAQSDRYRGVLGVAEDPIVSSDIIKDPRASIVDLNMTQVVDGDLLKVMSWYDNEWGYASQMVREAVRLLGAGYDIQ